MAQIQSKFIADSAVTNAKLANMADNTVKANKSGGSAAPSDLALSDVIETGSAILTISNGSKAIISPSDLSIQVQQSDATHDGYLSSVDWNTFNSKLSSSLTSAHILVGNGSNVAADVAVSGDLSLANTGAFTIANNVVSNAKLAQMAAHTIKGNNTGSTANAIDLTPTQVTAELNVFVGDSGSGGTKGLVPAPAAGDAAAGKFLKADGTFAVPASSITPKYEQITLSGTDITNQYVDLAFAAYGSSSSDNSILLSVVGGPIQQKTVDYTVSLTGGSGGVTRITFAGDLATGGPAELITGDILIINYQH